MYNTCPFPNTPNVHNTLEENFLGTRAPAAYSDVAANANGVPCTVSAHTPTVLPGYLLYKCILSSSLYS